MLKTWVTQGAMQDSATQRLLKIPYGDFGFILFTDDKI